MVRWSRAYVAPVKRMPFELLWVVFLEVFESKKADVRERVGEHCRDGPVRWDTTKGKCRIASVVPGCLDPSATAGGGWL